MKLRAGSRFASLGIAAVVAVVASGCVDPPPPPPEPSFTATAVSAGAFHNCAITDEGNLRCWGDNSEAQLGIGSQANNDSRKRTVAVTGIDTAITAVAPGGTRTCALTIDGGVKCWGWDGGVIASNGLLGTNSPEFRFVTIPSDVVGLSDVAAITSGNSHTCALTNQGGVKCWGFNQNGEVGDGSLLDRTSPTDVVGLDSGVVAISSGGSHTCALTDEGDVKCWGVNERGHLGDGTTTDSSTPVDVVGLSSDVVAISAGSNHTCAITSDGDASCWGGNGSGQLGDGTTTDSSTPVAVDGLDSELVSISTSSHIGIFGGSTCAVTTAGAVKCWGSNFVGQLGDGTTIDSATPVDVVGLDAGVNDVTLGGAHACAMRDGALSCWGSNIVGQLGDRTTVDRLTPVSVWGFSG